MYHAILLYHYAETKEIIHELVNLKGVAYNWSHRVDGDCPDEKCKCQILNKQISQSLPEYQEALVVQVRLVFPKSKIKNQLKLKQLSIEGVQYDITQICHG